MKKNFFIMVKSVICFFMLFFSAQNLIAQVGIGTTSPNASAMLDISSTSTGLLTPRMTTAQRTAITSPADGLIVYDTVLKSFYYYNIATSSWNRINSETNGRLNFKRIKSTDVLATVLAAELAAGGGTKYLLDSSTYYEINGTINVTLPIDLNNAYLVGIDANEDVLKKSGGVLFQGITGGTVKNLTITVNGGGLVFSLNGSALQNLIFRDSIFFGCSNLGTVNGYGLVFFSVIQYVSNATGITYENISQLLLSNIGWFGNNSGTFETFKGTFASIQKLGGFCNVNGSAVGIDVSSNPIITSDAVMESVVFTGTNIAGYVKPYTTGTYTGYNFNNNWNVRCAGIPTETDAAAVGSFYMDYPVGSGAPTTFSGNSNNPTIIKKVEGISNSENLLRFSSGGPTEYNKLIYLGKKKRFFQVTGSISFQVSAPGTFIVYIARNGTVISQTKIYGRGGAASDIVVLPINALVELSNSQFVEVYVQRYVTANNNDGIITPNMTITVK